MYISGQSNTCVQYCKCIMYSAVSVVAVSRKFTLHHVREIRQALRSSILLRCLRIVSSLLDERQVAIIGKNAGSNSNFHRRAGPKPISQYVRTLVPMGSWIPLRCSTYDIGIKRFYPRRNYGAYRTRDVSGITVSGIGRSAGIL